MSTLHGQQTSFVAKVSKKIYEFLVKKKASIQSRSQERWLEERDILSNLKTKLEKKLSFLYFGLANTLRTSRRACSRGFLKTSKIYKMSLLLCLSVVVSLTM